MVICVMTDSVSNVESIVAAVHKEKATIIMVDKDATRMTNDNLDQPTKSDNKVKDDAKLSNRVGYNMLMIDDVWKLIVTDS